MAITLTHFLRGPMEVVPIKDSDRREWFCPNRPMLRPMGDEEFSEKREQIDALLSAADHWQERYADAISQDQRDQRRV